MYWHTFVPLENKFDLKYFICAKSPFHFEQSTGYFGVQLLPVIVTPKYLKPWAFSKM